MLNKAILNGRLTKAPELKQTQNGKSVCSFTIAVDRNRDREKTDFVPIVAWGKTALSEPLVYEFGGLAPCHDGYEVSLFSVTVAVYGDGKAAHALAAVGLFQFGGFRQPPIKYRFVQHSVSSK